MLVGPKAPSAVTGFGGVVSKDEKEELLPDGTGRGRTYHGSRTSKDKVRRRVRGGMTDAERRRT